MDWRITPRRLSCVLLLAAVAFPLSAITPAPTAKTCDALTQWARDNRETLPRDYRGLLAYPASEQRAIYSNLSAGEKAGYWSDRIAVYLEEHSELTAGQQLALAEARAFMTSDFFAGIAKPGMPTDSAREEQLARFSQRMAAGLGDKASLELFYGFSSLATVQNASSSTCECRGLGDCIRQNIPADYCNGMEPCEAIVACGFALDKVCTGMCWIRDPEG